MAAHKQVEDSALTSTKGALMNSRVLFSIQDHIQLGLQQLLRNFHLAAVISSSLDLEALLLFSTAASHPFG